MSTQIPTPESVAHLIEGLLGKAVKTKKITSWKEAPVAVAEYRMDTGDLSAACLCDLPAGSNLGAALTLLPAPRAAECIKKKSIDEDILDNVREILNVASSLFNKSGGAHVSLKAVHSTPDKLPDDVAELVKTPASRLDVELAVPGYGPGKLSILTR